METIVTSLGDFQQMDLHKMAIKAINRPTNGSWHRCVHLHDFPQTSRNVNGSKLMGYLLDLSLVGSPKVLDEFVPSPNHAIINMF